MLALRFNVGEKHFDDITIVVISLNKNPRWPVIYCVFKFLRRSADGASKRFPPKVKFVILPMVICYL